MDIRQYQPSKQMLVLSDMFCKYFGQASAYYSFDLGGRVAKYKWTEYARNTRMIEETVFVNQLVTVATELLAMFPDMEYGSEECNGLISGLCNGRAVSLMSDGKVHRGIVTMRGVVWLDTFCVAILDPDQDHYENMAKIIKVRLDAIKFQSALLRRFF